MDQAFLIRPMIRPTLEPQFARVVQIGGPRLLPGEFYRLRYPRWRDTGITPSRLRQGAAGGR